VGAGGRQVVGPARQRRREPQNLAGRVRDDLHVHPVPLVFRGVIGPAVADAVALGERAVQEDEVRVVRAQRLQQARCLLGEQTRDRGDVGVGGTDGYTEGSGDTGEGVVATQVHECDQRTAVRREFAPPVTLTGDDEHRDRLDHGVRQVEYGRIRNQQGSCAAELRRRTPPSTAREPCPLRTPTSHHSVTRSVAVLKMLIDSARSMRFVTSSNCATNLFFGTPTPKCSQAGAARSRFGYKSCGVLMSRIVETQGIRRPGTVA
jgi:hypothetical protein